MRTNNVTLSTLLWAISWNVEELNSNQRVVFERTSLLVSDELPQILRNWYKPPRRHTAGIRTRGAKESLFKWAMETVSDSVNLEMNALKQHLRLPPSEVTDDLVEIKLGDLVNTVSSAAPVLWKLLHHAARPSNGAKHPNAVRFLSSTWYKPMFKGISQVVLMMTSMAAYTRSQQSCLLQKLNGLYFRSCGLSAKGFDALHAFGITILQKTMHRSVDEIASSAHSSLIVDLSRYPWFGCHDNINISFHVYKKRLDNQDHFDSGTAATVVIIKNPACKFPDAFSAREKLVSGSKTPISRLDILDLDTAARPHLAKLATYHILRILTEAQPFSYGTYYYKDDPLFDRPTSPTQLLTGPEHATCQYMLNTVHIEEASYEGNAKVLLRWLQQLKIETLDNRMRLAMDCVIIWVGDQLTVSCIRGLKRHRSHDLNSFDRLEFLKETFGWFHLLMTFEHSLHSQHYGTRSTRGLAHAFDLLQRKGLHTPSVQGDFHHHMQEALHHVAAARFRDLWCIEAGVRSLESLRDFTSDDLLQIAHNLVEKYASVAALDELDAKPSDSQDDVFAYSVLLNRDLLDYLILDDAIKTGDITTMEDILPRILFRFVGGRNSNYTVKVLELLQGLNREWPDDLK
jgi:hypothetical protein